MRHGGYVKFHRSLVDHVIFGDAELLRVWAFCMVEAKWTPNESLVGHSVETIDRGSFVTTRTDLHGAICKKTPKGQRKPSPSTLWRKLHDLASLGCVKLKTMHQRTTKVTLCNYEVYNGRSDEDEPHVNRTCPAGEPLTTFLPYKDLRIKEGEEGTPAEITAAPVPASQPAPTESVAQVGLSPEDLAVKWVFYRRGRKNQFERREAEETFREMIRLGFQAREIDAEIEKPDRDRTETTWQFKNRLMRVNGRGNKGIDFTGLQEFVAAGPG